MSKSQILTIAITTWTLATTQPALAEDDSRKAAQSLFDEARVQMSQGDFATACEKLAESQRLDPALGTLLNLALCNEQRGKVYVAWQQFTQAATRAHVVGDFERERIANDAAERIRSSLRFVKIVVSGATPGAWLRVDDVPIDPGLMGSGILVEPGAHHLAWGIPGKRVFRQLIHIGWGAGAQTIPFPVVDDPAAKLASTSPSEQYPARPWGRRVLVTAAYGVAAAGATTALLFGMKASLAWDERNRICEERCTWGAKQEGDRANRYAWIANAAAASALASATLGTLLLVSTGAKAASKHAELTGGPLPGGGYAQARLMF